MREKVYTDYLIKIPLEILPERYGNAPLLVTHTRVTSPNC